MEDNSEGGFQWWDGEVTDFINIWGDDAVQAKLESTYPNYSMFEEIAKEMAEHGHRNTWLQRQRKFKRFHCSFAHVVQFKNVICSD